MIRTNQISIYFHWPFCESKCPYCDFNSHVRKTIYQKEWLNAYLKNIKFWKNKFSNSIIQSIYFGGGTPSLIEPSSLSIILDKLNKYFSFSNDIEISLEANPSSVEKHKFKSFYSSGINRISIGVQSFNDNDLRNLGRKHSAQDAIAAVNIANNEFSNVNFDLIYGRQFQKISDWERELTFALSLGSQHISLYQLTIENGTTFANLLKIGKLKGLPNQDLSKKFYLITDKLCKENKFYPYEISNFAKKNFKCLHNLNYWRSGSFISIGPGAHGRYINKGFKFSYHNIKNPENWLEKSLTENNPIQEIKRLSKLQEFEETIMMGLRIDEGINLNDIQKKLGVKLNEERLEYLINLKFISKNKNNLRLLKKGKLLLDKVIQELLV